MEDGSAHVWWLVRRGEARVAAMGGSSSAVLMMSSLAQMLILLRGDVHLYPSYGQWERECARTYRPLSMRARRFLANTLSCLAPQLKLAAAAPDAVCVCACMNIHKGCTYWKGFYLSMGISSLSS